MTDLSQSSSEQLVRVDFPAGSVEVFRSLLRDLDELPGGSLSFEPDELTPSMVVYTMVGVAETFIRRKLEPVSQ